MRNNLVKVICEYAKENKDLMLVTADLGFNVLNPLFENFPKQYVNAGISEQNMTSVAAGLALSHKKVFTYSIGSFSTLRCLEQIRNDICYHNADVKIVALAAGFAYGSLGMSHHATEDIACMKVMPHITVFSPCDPIETRLVTKAAIEMNTPVYIRLGRGGEPNIHQGEFEFEVGKAYKLHDGLDACILSTGAITKEAMDAVLELENENIHVSLYSFPTIKPLDEELLINLSKKFNKIITLEEHQIYGGFASSIADAITDNNLNAKLYRLGMSDEFTSVVGSTEYLRHYYQMDKDAVIAKVKEIL